MAANSSIAINVNATVYQVTALLYDRAFMQYAELDFKSEKPNGDGVICYFGKGVTFSSWGEDISIYVTPIGFGMVRIDIHSECSMPTQLVDWGKNKQNVDNISQYILANIGRYTVAQQPAPSYEQTFASSGKKLCVKCGASIDATYLFCSVCGAKQD